MPNAQLIQQRTFAGGMDDFTPPDMLKEDSCISMVNFLPGDDAVPLPVRGGTERYAFLGDDPITGIHTFRRANGDDFVVAGMGDTLHNLQAIEGVTESVPYTGEGIVYSQADEFYDFEGNDWRDGWTVVSEPTGSGLEQYAGDSYSGAYSMRAYNNSTRYSAIWSFALHSGDDGSLWYRPQSGAFTIYFRDAGGSIVYSRSHSSGGYNPEWHSLSWSRSGDTLTINGAEYVDVSAFGPITSVVLRLASGDASVLIDALSVSGDHWFDTGDGMATYYSGATATYSLTATRPSVFVEADTEDTGTIAVDGGTPADAATGLAVTSAGEHEVVLTATGASSESPFTYSGFDLTTQEYANLHTFSESGRDLAFAVNNDTLYIANGADPLLKWSGREVGEATQNGEGLDDLTPGGSYTGTTPQEYIVEITATGTPDVFKWSDDGGETYTTGVNITGGDITLSDGVTIAFDATTGHTLGDSWTFWAGKAVECENAPVAKYVISFRDRLWVSDGTSRVWFSAPLDDSNWSGNELDDGGSLYIARDDGSVVTGLARMFNGVVIFKEADTYLWSYGDADNPGFSGQIDLLIPGVGCASHASIAYYAGSVIFLGTSSNGSYAIYRLQGEGIDEISIRIPQRLSDVLVVSQRAPCAVIYDHRYYLASDDPETGAQVRTVLYVHDLRRQGWTEFRGLSVGALSEAPSPDYIFVGSGLNGSISRYPVGTTDDGSAIAYSFESRPFATKNVFQDNRWRNVYADLEGTSLGSIRLGYAVDERDPEYQTFPLSSADYVFYDDDGVFYDSGAIYGVGYALIKARMPVDTASARGSTCKVFIEGETTQPLRIRRIALAFRPRKTRYGG